MIITNLFPFFTVHQQQQQQNTNGLVASQHQQQLELQHQRRCIVAIVQPADHQFAVVGMSIGPAGTAVVQDQPLHTRIEPKHNGQGFNHHVFAVSNFNIKLY